ncbi:MAG: YHS domain-containing protein, partial [Actinomycetota bacterium]|nr:YHS domain-containing protein [Actinomycetota bacterium]
LGPFLAIISFVCSVGNVPLAAALWQGGISFGGVVSFVFADLITLPLLAIYRKYYGTAITLRLLGIFWATMSIAGLAVEYLFKAARIPAPVRPRMIVQTAFEWNYTTVLNILALAGFAGIYWLYRHRDTSGGRFAKDPVCGMQVEIEHAPAQRTVEDQRTYFCSDHCAHRFDADPHTASAHDHANHDSHDHAAQSSEGDPVCGMTVDRATAQHTLEHEGATVYFCGPGCRDAFIAGPDAYPRRATESAGGGRR